jgi:hypothetical protein
MSSDFSEDETEGEVRSIGNDDESSDKVMTRQALLNVFELRRRKNSDWKWTKTDNSQNQKQWNL